jgi:Domain of unknown function (DUF4412)
MKRLLPFLLSAFCLHLSAFAFDGRIEAVTTRGNETNGLLYTVGMNFLRVEITATNRTNPVDIVDLRSGAVTLLFPHNRSFVRLHSAPENANPPVPGLPAVALPPGGLPPEIGPQPGSAPPPGFPAMPSRPWGSPPPGGLPPGVGLPASAGVGLPGMPALPAPPIEKVELRATGDQTNLFGLVCQRFELEQRGETLEVWATDRLVAYRPYLQNQPRRFRPRRIEDQWPERLAARKLFPMLVTLRYQSGVERFRFEVKSITPDQIADPDGKLFQPPPNYREIEPLSF